MKILYRRLFLYWFPAVLLFFGSDKLGISFSTDKTSDTYIKLALYGAGTIFSLVVVQYVSEKDKKKIEELSKSLKGVASIFRQAVSNELEKFFLTPELKAKGITDLQLNIRIFLPKRRNFFKRFSEDKFFEINNSDGLYVTDVEDLSFQVCPAQKMQGLVGITYNNRIVNYDFATNENQEQKYPTMDLQQKDVTSYCNFAISAPIFKPKNSTKVIAIVTFDGSTPVSAPEGRKWEEVVRKYCKIIHKNYVLINKK